LKIALESQLLVARASLTRVARKNSRNSSTNQSTSLSLTTQQEG
jgi:hypothetical protein